MSPEYSNGVYVDGRDLAANRTLQAVSVTMGATFTALRPTKLFDTILDTSLGSIHSFHFGSPDGKRFLISVSATLGPTTVVQHWDVGLKR